MAKVSIRPTSKEDVPLILKFIKELAAFEEAPEKVEATEEKLYHTLGFDGSTPYAKAAILYEDNEPKGMGLYFYNYSTWTATPGIYLEDLYVSEDSRGKGYGTAILAYLAREVQKVNGSRLEWAVLKWNTPAKKFYASIGAQDMSAEWEGRRVDGDALTKLGSLGPKLDE